MNLGNKGHFCDEQHPQPPLEYMCAHRANKIIISWSILHLNRAEKLVQALKLIINILHKKIAPDAYKFPCFSYNRGRW